MELTIGKKLGLGFGTVLALAVISAGITYNEVSHMMTSAEEMTEHTFPAVSACDDLLNGLNHSTAALRGYVILGDDPKEAEFFKADRGTAWKNMDEALAKLNDLYKTTADANDKRNLSTVQSSLEDLRKLEQDVEDIAQTDKKRAGRTDDAYRRGAESGQVAGGDNGHDRRGGSVGGHRGT